MSSELTIERSVNCAMMVEMRPPFFRSFSLMKSFCSLLALFLAWFPAGAQTIFNQNFDGGYTGTFSVGSYVSGGSPANTATTVLASGGNPNGCMRVTMTATTGSDTYTGQAQLQTVSGNTDANPADYILSFDA